MIKEYYQAPQVLFDPQDFARNNTVLGEIDKLTAFETFGIYDRSCFRVGYFQGDQQSYPTGIQDNVWKLI